MTRKYRYFKTTIVELPHNGGNYPVYRTVSGGVVVGRAGELTLHLDTRHDAGVQFRIYAPGTWRSVDSKEMFEDDTPNT